jgi:hypothetical protein
MSKAPDDTTKCLECGYGIPPIEGVRPGADMVGVRNAKRTLGRRRKKNDTYCSDFHFRIASNNQR